MQSLKTTIKSLQTEYDFTHNQPRGAFLVSSSHILNIPPLFADGSNMDCRCCNFDPVQQYARNADRRQAHPDRLPLSHHSEARKGNREVGRTPELEDVRPFLWRIW